MQSDGERRLRRNLRDAVVVGGVVARDPFLWAYPATGGAPVFLGTPALGGVRPDVAAVHGDQFREAGFALPLQRLVPAPTTWPCSLEPRHREALWCVTLAESFHGQTLRQPEA